MTLRFTFLSFLLFYGVHCFTQQFIRVGAEENLHVQPQFGILLAGGNQDNDNGMLWLAQRANGGDVVVLRASGGDLYNSYILSELGAEINSVTTIIITSKEQANNPEVCQAVDQAEMVFIAGGNQWNYYNHWKGTCLQQALNRHVSEKSAPIGGTSAGLAILGEVLFTAQNGLLWTEEALSDPFHSRVRLSKDFLHIPFLENVVTDSHYNAIYDDNNNRHGRHTAFLARMINDWQMPAKGIGVNEYTAVAIDEQGIARIFGHPSYHDYAWFLLANSVPETVEQGQALHWVNNENALSVYRVRGNSQGSNSFDLNNWQTGQGGEWFRWYVENGELIQQPAGYTQVMFNVSNSNTQQPLTDAIIRMSGLRSLKTNTQGEALFANALLQKPINLTVIKSGYHPVQLQITPTEDYQIVEVGLEPVSSSYETVTLSNHHTIYPNPASKIFWVKPAEGSVISVYSLYDLSGREILRGIHQQKGGFTIDISSLNQGVYILKLTDQNNQSMPMRVVLKNDE